MGYNVTALTNYVNEQSKDLIVKQQLTSKTASVVTVVPGVKGPTALNKLDTAVTFQANGCGFNATDSTVLSQRVITPGDIKVNEALCPKDLASKYTQHQLKAGARGEKEVLPFEEAYANLKASIIAAQIEKALWQGDTTSADGNLNKFDGYLKLIAASYLKDQATSAGAKVVNGVSGIGTVATTSGSATLTGTSTSFTTQVEAGDKIKIGANTYTVQTVGSNTSITLTGNAAATVSGQAYSIIPVDQEATTFATPYTAFSASTAYSIAMEIYRAMPATVIDKEDVVVFCGMDFFRLFVTDVTSKNFFHYTAEQANSFELTVPGSNMKLMGSSGLNNTGKIVAGSASNMFYGVDLLEDSERFEIFFAKEADQIRFISEFRAGAQVGNPEELVLFSLV